jgi:hypothetical protein
MNPFRRPRPRTADSLWADTLPSLLPRDQPAAQASRLPLLDEPLAGVDVDELQGQTVFDQFFGPDASLPR